MSDEHRPHNCACSCGSVRLRVTRPPMLRFMCHCTICQTVYGNPYADVTVVRASGVEIEDENLVAFGRHKAPPALDRGLCKSCRQPVAGFLAVAPGFRLAFVPKHMYPAESQILPSTMHIFYGSRTADVDDALPKHNGFWSSQWGTISALIPKLMAR